MGVVIFILSLTLVCVITHYSIKVKRLEEEIKHLNGDVDFYKNYFLAFLEGDF